VRNIFGFYPDNISLYLLALRHRSASLPFKEGVRENNERLEFLGDAILGAVITEMLYRRFPLKDEGFLTEIRSRIVSRVHLNKLSRKMHIDSQVISGRDDNNPFQSIDGDAFEALIGAIYLDKGFAFTRRIILDRIIKLHVDMDELEKLNRNYKSQLIEFAQREKKKLEFQMVNEKLLGHRKQYEVDVVIDGEIQGNGTDFSIKRAEQAASEVACRKFGITPSQEEGG
jgi:ribonuclease III